MVEDKPKVTPVKHKGTSRLFPVVIGPVLALDQLSKLWIAINRPQMELLPGFLKLVYVENTGAVFGLFQNHSELFVGLGIAGVIAILVFLHYFPPATILGVVSFALILSGAAGNLIDRIRLGYAIDFVSIHVQHIFIWPAFNIADVALTVGIFALIYYLYKSRVFSKADEHDDQAQS